MSRLFLLQSPIPVGKNGIGQQLKKISKLGKIVAVSNYEDGKEALTSELYSAYIIEPAISSTSLADLISDANGSDGQMFVVSADEFLLKQEQKKGHNTYLKNFMPQYNGFRTIPKFLEDISTMLSR